MHINNSLETPKIVYWKILKEGMDLLRGKWRSLIGSIRILYPKIGVWIACYSISSVLSPDCILPKLYQGPTRLSMSPYWWNHFNYHWNSRAK